MKWAALTACLAAGIQAALPIECAEKWATVFGGRDANFNITVSADAESVARVGWALEIGGRAVLRRETALNRKPGEPPMAELRIPVPPVKEGVAVSATLRIDALAPDGRQLAHLDKRLWVFHEDAFAVHAETLKKLDIRLFDPEETTSGLLKGAGVPFRDVRNVDAFAESGDGVLLIGAGVSFDDYQSLFAESAKAAAKGCHVIVLAPAGGSFEIPGTAESELPRPSAVTWRRDDVIHRLDKRLDTVAWAPGVTPARCSLQLAVPRRHIGAQVIDDPADWPWFRAEFANGGRLTVCGFRITETWADSPTPRYVLLRILTE